ELEQKSHQYLLCVFNHSTLSYLNNHEKDDNDTSENRKLHGGSQKNIIIDKNKKLLRFHYKAPGTPYCLHIQPLTEPQSNRYCKVSGGEACYKVDSDLTNWGIYKCNVTD
ncbi:12510_t:CDS:2, partial [Gigaspora margarita]